MARRAKADGFVLAMPIEKSGTKLFELEYGDEYVEHVDTVRPRLLQGSVPLQPGRRSRRAERRRFSGLAEVSEWATASGRRWLDRTPVPGTSRAAGAERGSAELRP